MDLDPVLRRRYSCEDASAPGHNYGRIAGMMIITADAEVQKYQHNPKGALTLDD